MSADGQHVAHMTQIRPLKSDPMRAAGRGVPELAVKCQNKGDFVSRGTLDSILSVFCTLAKESRIIGERMVRWLIGVNDK